MYYSIFCSKKEITEKHNFLDRSLGLKKYKILKKVYKTMYVKTYLSKKLCCIIYMI